MQEGAREIHLKEIDKLQGDTDILTKRVDKFENDEEVQQVYALLRKHGIEREKLCRFLLEVSVATDYQYWLHYHDMETEKEQKKDESKEDRIKKWQRENDELETPVKRDDSYESTHDVIAGLRAQLLRGTYDPRGLGEAGKAAAKKLGQIVAKKAFEYFVLAPLAPFLVLPWKIYGLVDKVIGSDHETVWLVSLQLCLQRLLLAAHDLSIDRHYEDLSKEWKQSESD